MKMKKFTALFLSLVMLLSLMPTSFGVLTARASQKLFPTESVNEFDLGSDAVGGSGVEGDKNWIKVVQMSNKLRLFDDVPQGTDVAALRVDFSISNWSGVPFYITWGSNVKFIGDAGATWCGPDAFASFSKYIIDREGDYTVICDLAQLCRSKEKSGIDWLQTCEMVIGNVAEGDETVIEVKNAYIYSPGEEIPESNASPYVETAVDTIAIDPSKVSKTNNGVFEGWGTSLCWYGNRIGGSEKATEESAELFYNAETGLGLNIIRFNVGGGDDPTHTHIQRSDSNMPGYWTDYNAETGEFEYDFTKDENQRNVLYRSIEECPEMLVEMFSNSAPYFMTRSGCTSGTTDSVKSNITTENMPAFADYMATVVEFYVNEGVNVVSVEPMNEPSNGWNVAHYGVKQEGCSVEKGEEQSSMLIAMDEAMKAHGLSDIALAGVDETNDTTTNQALKKLSDEALAVLDQINTHTYSRNESSSTKLYRTALDLGKKLWMTENDNGGVQGTNAGEMGAALNFASQITADLNNMQPSAWIMWQAIGSYCDENNEFDPDTLDQKTLDTEGFWGVCYADMNTETVVKTKKYYAFGQYTRFIRPGYSLISVDDSYTTAAFSAEDGKIVIVTYNTAEADREVSFDLTAFAECGAEAEVIRTSGDYENGENWAVLENIEVKDGCVRATVTGNSITTFVVNGASHDIASEISKPIEEEPETETEKVVVELAESRIVPAEESVTGRICFANGDWGYTVMTDDATEKTGITVSTMENGAYTLTLPGMTAEDGSAMESVGAVVFCIDLMGYSKLITGIDAATLISDEEKAEYKEKVAETVRVKVTSITQDGEEMEFDASKVAVGDTEENGNLRIEFYNMYGPTAEDYAADPEYICFSEELAISFEIELAPMAVISQTDASAEDSEQSKKSGIPPVVLAVGAAVLLSAAVTASILIRRRKNK